MESEILEGKAQIGVSHKILSGRHFRHIEVTDGFIKLEDEHVGRRLNSQAVFNDKSDASVNESMPQRFVCR
jgi:hypothetical protein